MASLLLYLSAISVTDWYVGPVVDFVGRKGFHPKDGSSSEEIEEDKGEDITIANDLRSVFYCGRIGWWLSVSACQWQTSFKISKESAVERVEE